MTRPNPSTALAEVLVDEMARNDVRLVVVSPGSRSAALAIAAAGHPDLETVVMIDERSAAFFALGRAKADGVPAAVVSTSGTAPANWYPAVVEADMSLTPLLLISADRPAELRGVGANQTIDQVGLFGGKVRHFSDIEAPGDEDLNATWRGLVCEAVGRSRGVGNRPGPVHLNVAFREPTVPVSDDGRSQADPYRHPVEGRSGRTPWVAPPPTASTSQPVRLPGLARGLVIGGDGVYDREGLVKAASVLGWPVLGTALSGLRGRGVIDSYHHLLGGPLPRSLVPDLVVAIGHIGPNERLDGLFAAAEHRIRVDSWGRTIDPGRNATVRVRTDPVGLISTVDPVADDGDWEEAWQRSAGAVRSAMASWLDANPRNSGAHVVAGLDRAGWGCLVVGSSLPIREVDAFLTRPGPVIANRGASGVDGFVSTALGVASAVPGTVGLSGDLGLFHDSNGYLGEEAGDLTMVVLENGGGGLFDSLPTATHAPFFERLFITPHHRRIVDLARFHGLRHTLATEASDLAELVEDSLRRGGRSVVEVPIDRALDRETRKTLDQVGRSALGTVEP